MLPSQPETGEAGKLCVHLSKEEDVQRRESSKACNRKSVLRALDLDGKGSQKTGTEHWGPEN